MVARNLLEVDNSIFYPRIDISGEKTGITGMEFPIFNYQIYWISEIFGYQHWYGRLINLLLSSIGLFLFYKLIRKYFSERVSFYSTLILIVSIWFQFSRKIMPDTFSMSFIIASIYYASNYLECKQNKKSALYLLLYLFLMMIGVLSKLPSGYLLILLIIFFWDKKIALRKNITLAIVTCIGLIPVFVWYFYWVPYLVETYGFWHFFMGKSFSQGFYEIMQNLPETLSRFYDTALKYIGFAVFLFGLGYALVKKNKVVLSVFFLSLFSFSIIVFKAGLTFPHHNYYIIPFVPVMAFVAGYGLSKIKHPTYALLILLTIVIEGIANQQHDFFIKDDAEYFIDLESELDSISNREDLIIINSGEYPTAMYFAHRKGWVAENEKLNDPKYIDELRKKGLKYMVILKSNVDPKLNFANYPLLLENENYFVYGLKTDTNNN
jgi:4-amino-4-deoxy-L-arabinose transferase-like glycosyltransferase